MKSVLPKALQPLARKPLLQWVLETATDLAPASIHIVYGHGGAAVPEALPSQPNVNWVEQAEQLGTAHAVQQALPGIPDDHTVLVLYGDVPLIRATTLQQLLDAAANGLSVLTAEVQVAFGYGRVIRNRDNSIEKIVEHKDANEAELAIREINTGFMACSAKQLRDWIDKIENKNVQGEFYLTDCIAMAVADGITVTGIVCDDFEETHGINDRIQLAHAETLMRQRITKELMQAGVSIIDPERIDVRGELQCGKDVVIDVNVIFEGKVKLGNGVKIGPFTVIVDSEIDNGSEIKSHCHIENAVIGKQCQVGPFARIRPETYLDDEARIGNFVETKKSHVGKGSKINHLAYVGDAEVGKEANIGAGTVTCNYDGVNKHKTVIGDNAFIGSNTALVAPVRIGKGATVGAGSVISKDAADGELVITRAKQVAVTDWKRPKKG